MRKFISYTFVILYLIAMLRPVSPFVEYAINYNYISEVLCINQDKPEMNCKGKCYVMQQLEKQKTEDFNSLQISMEEYPIGFVEILTIDSNPVFFIQQQKPYFYQDTYRFVLISPDEHPPEMV